MAEQLRQTVQARGLPVAVAEIATRGGAAVHAALEYRAEPVSPMIDGPARTVITSSGRDDLVPLWSCGTTTILSAADGSVLEWDAEEDSPSTVWPDWDAAVRALLTDLWEDEEPEDAREQIARLLLPENRIAAALTPEER